MTATVLTLASEGRAYEDLPKKQRAFIDEIILTGDAVKAYLAAGYKDGPNAKAKAAQMKSRLRTHIAQAARDLSESVDMAILGLKTVRELAESAESEAVKLKAAIALVERGMPDRPAEVHHTHDHQHHVSTLSPEDLDKRIRALTAQLHQEQGEVIDAVPESSTIN